MALAFYVWLSGKTHHLSHYCWGEEDAIGDPFLEVFEGLRPSAWDSQGRLTCLSYTH